MSALLSTAAMTGTAFWRQSRDGDPSGLALYRRHYSRRRYADGRDPALFVGPGEKTVLLSHDDDALFVWRRFIDASGQDGVNCAVFRNESAHLSSAVILDAETWAADRAAVVPRAPARWHAGMCGGVSMATGPSFHLVLANPRPLRTPIPFKGALGLRRLDADTITRIEAQL